MEEKNTEITEEQRKRNLLESKKWSKEHPIESANFDLMLKIASIGHSIPKKEDLKYISNLLRKLKVKDLSEHLLHTLGFFPNEDIVKLFLKKGISPNQTFWIKTDKEKYQTNLFSTSCMNASNSDVIKFLIEHGAVVNQCEDLYANSPLINACMNMHDNIDVMYEIVSILLDNGAQVNYSNIHGKNALMVSLFLHSNPKVIKKLLEAGADIKHKDKMDNTIELYAARYAKSTQIIDTLIHYGVNFKNNSNVIIQACENKDEIVKKYIIEKALSITPEMRERAKKEKEARDRQNKIDKENSVFESWVGFAAPIFTLIDGLILKLGFSVLGVVFLSLFYGGIAASWVTLPILNLIAQKKFAEAKLKNIFKILVTAVVIAVECFFIHLFLTHFADN